jgi:hypothetical protein
MDITKIDTAAKFTNLINDSMTLKQQKETVQRLLTQLGAVVAAIKDVKTRGVVDAAECDAAIAKIKTDFAAALAGY